MFFYSKTGGMGGGVKSSENVKEKKYKPGFYIRPVISQRSGLFFIPTFLGVWCRVLFLLNALERSPVHNPMGYVGI